MDTDEISAAVARWQLDEDEETSSGAQGGEESDEDQGLVFASSVRVVHYQFTVKDKCLSGPPTRTGRRWSLAEYIGQKLGGSFTFEPEHLLDDQGSCPLSPAAKQTLREKVFGQDLSPKDVLDYHCHIAGHGDSGSGCYLHSSTKTWKHPLKKIKSLVFMSAAQAPDLDGGDVQYISRLVRLVRHYVPACVVTESEHSHGHFYHGKLCLLSFDKFYEKNGEENWEKTTMFVPNEYSLKLAREFPEMFISVGSVNPYRRDALEELQHLAEQGVTIIKWLPNSMGINPSDDQCVPFYRKMKELGMALLVHSGEEHAVNAAFIDNTLGNPLLLRRPLDCGVKVIAAHCTTEGNAVDFENGASSVPCFNLWLRLMREHKYKGLLFGDISAVCGFLRVPYLQRLLEATDVHSRLVYGSDYPVPAIATVVWTSRLCRSGLVTQEESTVLNELYNYNPLLFDLACKRLLRGPQGQSFPASIFKQHPDLPPYNRQQ